MLQKPAVAAVMIGALLVPSLLPQTTVAAPRAEIVRVDQGGLSREDLRARALALDALRRAGRIPADNPFQLRNARILAALAELGLPTRADGVRIFVMGENTRGPEPDHGRAIVRTMAGRAGLAQGADVRIYETPDEMPPPPPSARARLTARQLVNASVESLLFNPLDTRELIEQARRHHVRDGQPTLVVISVGNDVNDEANAIAQAMIEARRGTPLYRSAVQLLGRAPHPRDYPRIFAHYQRELMRELERPEVRARLDANRAQLEATVRDGRAEGVLVFFAVGNSREPGRPDLPGASRDTANVPGMITVGVSHPATNEPIRWSSEGARILMPGVKLPIGAPDRRGNATNQEGSSFSGPDAAALAALMIRAGVTDVDELDRLLTCPAVTRLIEGSTRAPEEVAAVILAASGRGCPAAAN